MYLYHGGIQVVQSPDLSKSRKKLDFGAGFYLTSLQKQAEDWAKRKAADFIASGDERLAVVSVFEFSNSDKLFYKVFANYDEEWLMFVVNNRRTDMPPLFHGYDVIQGSIADDRVAEEVDRFIQLLKEGRVSNIVMAATLQELSFQKKNDQYCFATSKALSCLRFMESYPVS